MYQAHPGRKHRVGMTLAARLLALGGLLLLACSIAFAESWPARPVKLVVPYPPGGSSDMLARIFADGLSAQLGHPVIVENKGGAATIIGTEYVAAQHPDGYTLLLCTPGLAINPSLYDVHYDPGRSFTYVNMLAALPLILVAHPDLPAGNIDELVALAKSNPGALSYSSYGMGSASHIAGELLQQMTGAKMLHIPFKGSSAAVTEVVAGRTQLSFTTVPMVIPMIRAGRVKAIAVTTSLRLEVMKEVPTIAESLPGFEVTSWLGLCAPAGLPNEIVVRLNKATNEIVNAPESRTRLAEARYVVAGGTPEEFRSFVVAETRKWSTLIREANVQVQ